MDSKVVNVWPVRSRVGITGVIDFPRHWLDGRCVKLISQDSRGLQVEAEQWQRRVSHVDQFGSSVQFVREFIP